MNDRPGCLTGLFKIFALTWLFDWLQDNFGFGKGCSCSGIGCGIILLLIFLALLCSTMLGTDWTRLILNWGASLI
ncbi:MAG TPA: hypothetical protein VLM80_07705 [Anaerolineales bacterium]|nr:hypothetical protein [Anaerolineales bacterium]